MVNRISLVVTTYNSSQFLDKLSIFLLQSSRHLHEIVIVDDCSTDRSPSILEYNLQCASCDVRFYSTPRNSGRPAIPRNIGLDNASGDWIMFLDADDLPPLDYAGQMANANLQEDCLYSLNRHKVREPELVSYGHAPRFMLIPANLLKYKNIVCFSGAVLGSSRIGDHRFQDTYLEDWLFFRDVQATGKLKIRRSINMSLQYRHAANSLTPKKLQQTVRVSKVSSRRSMPFYAALAVLLMLVEKIVFVFERGRTMKSVDENSSNI